MNANEQNPWAERYQIRAKGSVLGSHIAELSEDFAAAIKRPVWGRWWLIMHTLCISVILSNLNYTHPLYFFNAQNWKLMNEYGSDLLFVAGTLKLHNISMHPNAFDCSAPLHPDVALPRAPSFTSTFIAQSASYLPWRDPTLPTVRKHNLSDLPQHETCQVFFCSERPIKLNASYRRSL